MANPPLVIYGCGTMCNPVVDIVRHFLQEPEVFLVDDDPARWGGEIYGYPIVSPEEALSAGTRRFFCTIGDNAARCRVTGQAIAGGHLPWTIAHPSAICSPAAEIAPGCFLMGGVIVNAEARVGMGTMLSSTSVVEHHNDIGEYVLLGPGVKTGGGVTIGDRTLIGLGSSIRPCIRIGEACIVGAGSVVVKDVPPGSKVAGNPARPLPAKGV